MAVEKLRFDPWGVRGSFPVTKEGFLSYGGNTSCFSLLCGDSLVVFDAGSGLTALGERLERERGVRSVHILMSHAHLDHIMGLPPFLSGAGRERAVHLYGAGSTLAAVERLVGEPYWPCSLRDSGAALHRVAPGAPFRLEGGETGARLSAMEGTHPGGCLWYRLEYEGRSVAYLLDCEVDPALWPEMARFARGAGLLVWDASFPPGQERPGWGHSTWAQGTALSREAGAERVLMAHYARELDDRALERLERDAAQAGDACIFAREGMEIEL